MARDRFLRVGFVLLVALMVGVAARAVHRGGFLALLVSDPARFLVLQRRSDFDQNFTINFKDFTIFAAAYGTAQNSAL